MHPENKPNDAEDHYDCGINPNHNFHDVNYDSDIFIFIDNFSLFKFWIVNKYKSLNHKNKFEDMTY